MSFQRYDNGGNNKFPLTNYGVVKGQDLSQYGAAIGTDTQDVYKLEVVVKAGDTVTAAEFANTIASVLPTGALVTDVLVDAAETFDATINVGIAQKADGAGAVATALYVGTPTVGTTETGIVLAPLDEVITQDYLVTVDASGATAGKAKVNVYYRNAIMDID